MAALTLDPFRILLNNLSNELEEKDLQSLKNICAEWIPGGQREQIKNGWDLLSHLRRRNIIGDEPEMVANLLMIIKVLKRRDLIHLVKRHIAKHYEQPHEIFKAARVPDSIYSLTSRNDQLALNIDAGEDRFSAVCWVLNCCCCELTCYNNCVIFVTFLFTFFAVAAILAWYASIPEVTSYLKSNEDRKSAGPYIIGFLFFVAISSFLWAICRFCFKTRYIYLNRDHEDNERIYSEAIQRGAGNNSTEPSRPTTREFEQEGSVCSSPVTPSCSLSSLDTAASTCNA